MISTIPAPANSLCFQHKRQDASRRFASGKWLLRYAILLILLGSWLMPHSSQASFQETSAEVQSENSEEKSGLQPIAFGKDSNAVEHPVIQKPKLEPKTEQQKYRKKMLPVVWLLLLGITRGYNEPIWLPFC